jgi:HD-like signal output (HDOD) protein
VAVLPQVVFKIMEMTGADNSSASALERAIQVDPGFSTRILTQANSAYFSLPRKVTSIREAIVFVGFKSVRELAMTIGVFDLFLGKNDKSSLRRRTWWRLSLDTAICAKVLAADTRSCKMEEAYTCGLLHCIGKTLMDRSTEGDYEKVEVLIAAGAPDYLAEKAVFGCDHQDVNLAACQKWGFPEELLVGLEYLHEPLPDTKCSPLKAVTALASRIAGLTVSGSSPQETRGVLPAWSLNALQISPERTIDLVQRGQQAIAEAKLLMR